MNKDAIILITGGNGLVGHALKRSLVNQGYKNIFTPRSSEYDLSNMEQTLKMFANIQRNILKCVRDMFYFSFVFTYYNINNIKPNFQFRWVLL